MSSTTVTLSSGVRTCRQFGSELGRDSDSLSKGAEVTVSEPYAQRCEGNWQLAIPFVLGKGGSPGFILLQELSLKDHMKILDMFPPSSW